MHPFRFGTTVWAVTSRGQVQELARRAEGAGYSTLCVADHLGLGSMFPTIVSAGDATTTLRFGTLVVNNDFHMPLRLAQDAATTDVLTEGRLELGLGSGWARPEYELLGISYERPSVRAGRLAETIPVLRKAWAGEPSFSVAGRKVSAVPPPMQQPHPPLLIGGNSDALLSLAAREADIVGFTGLAWRRDRLVGSAIDVESVEERVGFVRKEAGDRFDGLELNALSQMTQVTDEPEQALRPISERFGIDPAVAAESPFTLVGPVPVLIDKLVAIRERLGLNYFVVFEQALDAFAPVVEALAGT